MIVRALRLRHGRIALPRSNSSLRAPARSWRPYATSIDEPHPSSNSELGPPVPAGEILTDPPSSRSINPFAGVLPSASETASTFSADAVRTVPINDPDHPVARQYAIRQHQKDQISRLGSTIPPHYKPHELLTNPPRPSDITLELLLASGAHLGHATQLWHPGNAQYIFGVRGAASGDPIHIISLDVTASHLRRACKVVEAVTQNGGLVLFVGSRKGQARTVVKAASMAKGCHLFTKWTPGTLTNGQQILGNCGKKIVDEKDEQVHDFDEQLHDLPALKPDLVVCLNPLENYVLLRECGQNGIPTIGVIDTDCNPTWVTYPIPANDDSLRCIQVIAGTLGRAGESGQMKRLELAAKGIVTYRQENQLKPLATRSRSSGYGRQDATRGRKLRTQFTEADLPSEDLDGADVEQFEKDQQLLAAAEESGLGLEEVSAEDTVEDGQVNEIDHENSFDENLDATRSVGTGSEGDQGAQLDPSLLPDEAVAANLYSPTQASELDPQTYDTASDTEKGSSRDLAQSNAEGEDEPISIADPVAANSFSPAQAFQLDPQRYDPASDSQPKFELDDLARLVAERERSRVEIADPAAEPDPETYESSPDEEFEAQSDSIMDAQDVNEMDSTRESMPSETTEHVDAVAKTGVVPDVDDGTSAIGSGTITRSPKISTNFSEDDLDEPTINSELPHDVHTDQVEAPTNTGAPTRVTFNVNNAPVPTATDPTAREEQEDDAESETESTWNQVSEVEKELGEEPEDGGEMMRYEKGEGVRGEKGMGRGAKEEQRKNDREDH